MCKRADLCKSVQICANIHKIVRISMQVWRKNVRNLHKNCAQNTPEPRRAEEKKRLALEAKREAERLEKERAEAEL